MYIKRLKVKNYKILKNADISLNPDKNIFVGDNNAGKSTLLEALSIATIGKLNGYKLSTQIKASLFNNDIRKEFCNKINNPDGTCKIELPEINIEIYFDNDLSLAEYRGSNNSSSEDAPGIKVSIVFDKTYENEFKKMLADGEINDIPVEFYKVEFKTFSSADVFYPHSKMKAIFLDTTRKDYSYAVSNFISESVDSLEKQKALIEREYRKSRSLFQDSEIVKKLNQDIANQKILDGQHLALGLREGNLDDWKHQLSISLEDIPFENIGFGTQNMIKIELALAHMRDKGQILLLEEPENNLSFSAMNQFLDQLLEMARGKQVFLSTHSSYIANRLNLKNIQFVNRGKVKSFNELQKETQEYFEKLPGYDTLRVMLAKKVILVEGPTDELIIQRAYEDLYQKLPIQDGIDVFAIGSLAFKRYCDICNLLSKEVIVVTDNDGDIDKNIKKRYADYLVCKNIRIIYELDKNLHTIEPSVLAVNCDDNGEPTQNFLESIGYKVKRVSDSNLRTEVEKYMHNNKTGWALSVFKAKQKIIYPKYIKEAITEAKG